MRSGSIFCLITMAIVSFTTDISAYNDIRAVYKRLLAFTDSAFEKLETSPIVYSWDKSSIKFQHGSDSRDTLKYDSGWIGKQSFQITDSSGNIVRNIKGVSIEISEDRTAAIPVMIKARLHIAMLFTDSIRFRARAERIIDINCIRTAWQLEPGDFKKIMNSAEMPLVPEEMIIDTFPIPQSKMVYGDQIEPDPVPFPLPFEDTMTIAPLDSEMRELW